MSKHVHLALVSLYSHRRQKGKICQGFYHISQSSPIAVSCEASVRLASVHVPHYIGLLSPNAIELATKGCFLLFDGSEVSVTDIIYVGKIMQLVVPLLYLYIYLYLLYLYTTPLSPVIGIFGNLHTLTNSYS